MIFNDPEGATPIDDISGLIPAWVKTQDDLNIVEAENISLATRKYLKPPISSPLKWFNVPTLQKIHRDMLGEVWDWAGTFRLVGTIPGVLPFKIKLELENLCSEVSFWCSGSVELTLIEQAAIVHHRLVYIHPFLNGNGRFSRLVADRFLKAWKISCPHWPVDLNNDGDHRKEYLHSLRSADRGDMEPLIRFMELHGAKDPNYSELEKVFKGSRLELLKNAYRRRGYKITSSNQ